MALTHKTVIGGITINREGNLSILFKLLVVEGAVEYSAENHRLVVERGQPLDTRLQAVSDNLVASGRQPISPEQAAVITDTAQAAWNSMDTNLVA